MGKQWSTNDTVEPYSNGPATKALRACQCEGRGTAFGPSPKAGFALKPGPFFAFFFHCHIFFSFTIHNQFPLILWKKCLTCKSYPDIFRASRTFSRVIAWEQQNSVISINQILCAEPQFISFPWYLYRKKLPIFEFFVVPPMRLSDGSLLVSTKTRPVF